MEKTFKRFLESKGQSKSTRNRFFKDVMMFINWTEDERIESEFTTYRELLSYVQYLKIREVKQRTIQLYINSLKHYFSWCIERNLITENPTRNINIKGVKRIYLYDILKKNELELLFNSFENKDEEEKEKNKNQNWFKVSELVSKRNKVILGLMIYQGLGASELSKLELKDVKLREGLVFIAGSRKSNEREMKLESVQILDLMEYTLQVRQEILNLNNKTSDCLFVSNGVSNEFRSIMSKLMHKIRKKNPRITSSKQIRASVITGWLKNYNLREAQYLAGHKFVSSTEAYLINDFEGLQEDIGKYHPF